MGAFTMVGTPSVICGQAILGSYLEITNGTARGDSWSKTNSVDQKQDMRSVAAGHIFVCFTLKLDAG